MPNSSQLITPHFSLSEFRQPALYGISLEEYPVRWIQDRLLPLCNILEIIRTEFRDMPITILSGGGYRSIEWNRKHHERHPGAVLASQHCHGRAADIKIFYHSAAGVHGSILSLYERKLINIGGLGLYSTFVHIDIRIGGNILAQWRG